MNLAALVDARQIRRAYARLREKMIRGTTVYSRILGYRGGSDRANVHWRPDAEIWFHYNPSSVDNRLWCCYGVQNPVNHKMLSITAEINPPREGVNRRIRGAFLKDGAGRVYLAHSGGVGGGRKGIGKEAFSEFYRGAIWSTVSWQDGTESDMILIGCLSDPRLPLQVAHFVHEVNRFKLFAVDEGLSDGARPRSKRFRPEFAGRRRPYSLSGTVFSTCDHGLVVNQLADELAAMRIRHASDYMQDLFTLTRGGRIGVLFEVKTSIGRDAIYKGVGQLMFHACFAGGEPRKVLVIPGCPNRSSRRALERLGIEVLNYRWRGKRIKFGNLHRFLSHRA